MIVQGRILIRWSKYDEKSEDPKFKKIMHKSLDEYKVLNVFSSFQYPYMEKMLMLFQNQRKKI